MQERQMSEILKEWISLFSLLCGHKIELEDPTLCLKLISGGGVGLILGGGH